MECAELRAVDARNEHILFQLVFFWGESIFFHWSGHKITITGKFFKLSFNITVVIRKWMGNLCLWNELIFEFLLFSLIYEFRHDTWDRDRFVYGKKHAVEVIIWTFSQTLCSIFHLSMTWIFGNVIMCGVNPTWNSMQIIFVNPLIYSWKLA